MIIDSVTLIGDVHGEASKLERALQAAAGRSGLLVLLGDYVDRGPHSARVLELLLDAKRTLGDRMILLRGNHEQVLLTFLATGHYGDFVRHGGLRTIASFGVNRTRSVFTAFRESFPPDMKTMLDETSIYYETSAFLASHCGYSPRDKFDRSIETMVNGRHPELFGCEGNSLGKLAIFGHYPQQSRRAFVADGVVCLDAGCGTFEDAPLATLELPEGVVKYFE